MKIKPFDLEEKDKFRQERINMSERGVRIESYTRNLSESEKTKTRKAVTEEVVRILRAAKRL